ncbi:hypothetical protein PMM47T1_16103 [Pseudomonas sp. M47T1]|uniref:hypothetical protein n=1 Tax=Pseudomonas sp. M47T1 TaxID=1179778 RepID=UPI0002608030|nr:hypothetical protein [Pseudomonas sp. M47T1]EIK95625.1 hypothetical protein PMM47T1_16103 [Pseudomonas sp. M47T1]
MPERKNWTLWEILLAFVAVSFVLFIQETVPFLMMPTLGQAIWSMGFSESLANGSIFSLFAHDIGIPKPAAIAFGLAGAWPASLFIRLGLSAADAYSITAALWVGLGFLSACTIALRLGTARPIALIGATAWSTMPVIWAHAGYSMLSWGIALLPFYFLAALKLFSSPLGSRPPPLTTVALYFTATIIAVFMDGYTFMMFASGSSILLLHTFITRPELRKSALQFTAPIHATSFGLAYFLYSSYIGKSNFDIPPLEFFRGWGIDLSYITIPTRGVLWLPDALGLSVKRTDEVHFGDASVWTTTFFLPVLIIGLAGWWRTRSQLKRSSSFLLIALFGIYMSLGPSLKIDSVKPESLQASQPQQQSALMPANYAVAPTGNAWMSEKLPGFNVMRASYRWSALGIFGLWALTMLWASQAEKKAQQACTLALAALVITNLPNIHDRWRNGTDNRLMFLQIDDNLVTRLSERIHPGEKVLFLPWGNDFMANYLAPKVGFRTFNIGGDKNLAAAQASWPEDLGGLAGVLSPQKAQAAALTLTKGTVDTLVIPYFHMLWAPHVWPCLAETTAQLTEEQQQQFRGIPDFRCPTDSQNTLKPFVDALKRLQPIEVSETSLFAVARLRPEFVGDREKSEAAMLANTQYPISISPGLEGSALMLREGWYGLETKSVWSHGNAKLMLPIPDDCARKSCNAVLKFVAFNATLEHPISITFSSEQRSWHWNEQIQVASGNPVEVPIPFSGARGTRIISIAIPQATSPQALTGSTDNRILGIALQQINLVKE